MASPLLASIDARIAAARNPIDAACLRAERAGLLARQGDLDEARAELAALHAQHGRAPHAVVSAWLHLADGLVLHFTNQAAAARDRLMRSLALSTAAQERPVQALSAAWLAQIEYLREDFTSCARSLLLSFQAASEEDHSARSRACLVAAQCFHWAERLDLALKWYQRTRGHATVEGDQATTGAIIHNMAWLRVLQARRTSVSASAYLEEVRQILYGAESLGNFDSMTGMAPLASLVPVLRAHVLTLLERYGEARDLFITHTEPASSGSLQRLKGPALVDLAWCRANVGDLEEALGDADMAQTELDESAHGDERAFIHGRLVQVYTVIGLTEKARYHEKMAAAAWAAHDERQTRLVSLVTNVCEDSNAY